MQVQWGLSSFAVNTRNKHVEGVLIYLSKSLNTQTESIYSNFSTTWAATAKPRPCDHLAYISQEMSDMERLILWWNHEERFVQI